MFKENSKYQKTNHKFGIGDLFVIWNLKFVILLSFKAAWEFVNCPEKLLLILIPRRYINALL